MKVREFIEYLKKLNPDYEIGVLAASAYARPPVVETVNPFAWISSTSRERAGFQDVKRAYIIRPEQDILK